jgi:hypothetical protein
MVPDDDPEVHRSPDGRGTRGTVDVKPVDTSGSALSDDQIDGEVVNPKGDLSVRTMMPVAEFTTIDHDEEDRAPWHGCPAHSLQSPQSPDALGEGRREVPCRVIQRQVRGVREWLGERAKVTAAGAALAAAHVEEEDAQRKPLAQGLAEGLDAGILVESGRKDVQ